MSPKKKLDVSKAQEVATDWAWDDCQLGGIPLLVLLAMAREVDENYEVQCTQGFIAELIVVDRKTVNRSIKKLIEFGHVVTDRDGPRANIYSLRVPNVVVLKR